MKHIITVDTGTSSLRSIIWSKNGQVLYSSQRNYSPFYCDNGFVEQNPTVWITSLMETLSDISQYAKTNNIKVKAIAVTSQRSSVIPVDHEGVPLTNAIMWQDKRTIEICDELQSENQFVYSKTGSKISSVFSAPKMLWLKRHEPSIYSQSYKLIGVHDLILHRLTGNFVTDQTTASRTLLMNIYSGQWDESMLKLFDLDSNRLCKLLQPGSICGYLREDIASATGLQKGIPVITAGGDQQCAALGLGVFNADTIEVNTGTGAYVVATTNKPIFDPDMRFVCNLSAIPGKWILEAGILTGGTIYRWFNNLFYSDNPSYDIFANINKDAMESPVCSNGLILMPHFEGSAVPSWNPYAKGMFFNISLGTKKSDFARAILEGITAEIAGNISLLERFTDPVTSVNVGGGFSKFDLYNTIQADMYNKTITRYCCAESSSRGAWISAAKTTGLFSSYEDAFTTSVSNEDEIIYTPVMENVERYTKLKHRMCSIYDALDFKNIYNLCSESL